jgi:RND family efflux transporter MFP subunit
VNVRTRPPVAALAIIAVVAFLDSCGGDGRAAANERTDAALPLVRVAPVAVRQVRREIETTAWLESEHQVTVLAKIAGRVAEVLVDEGREVAKGDLLARLDMREAQAALDQVEVQAREAKVAQQLAELEVDTAESRAAQAGIEFEKAQAELRRQEQLGPGVGSPKVLEDARFARDAAEKALRVAEFGARKAKLDAERAANTILELDARLRETKLRLEEHEIRSPIAGIVAQRFVKGGETIGNATQLFVVLDQRNLTSYMQRPQIELPLVRNARDVVFTADAWPERDFHGRIDLVSPVVDRETSSFKMRMRVVGDAAELLRPGMFVRVRILTEEQRDALMVPKAALLNEGDQTIVFALRDGRAHQIVLRPGLEQQEWIEALSGVDDTLTPGDLVIVTGQDDLKDQDRVETVEDR